MKHFILLGVLVVNLVCINAQPFSQTTIASNVIEPVNLTRVDLDKDGDLDFICFEGDTDLEFFSNNGDGTYTQTNIYSGLDGPGHFEVADMDNDGELDIIASDMVTELFVFLKNDGNENFTANIITQDAGDINNPFHFVVDNFDGDNYKDIVVCAQHAFDAYGVFFVKNNGDGTFATPDQIEEDDFVNMIAAGDIDGDTDIDIIVSKNGMFTNGGLYKGINNGSGSFTYSAITTTAKFNYLKMADMDGDTDLDLIVLSNDFIVYWYENDGSASYTSHAITTPYESIDEFIEFEPINIGNDSDMDLFFFTKISGDTNMDRFKVGYLENDGSQNFSIQLLLEEQPEVQSVVPFDLASDGDVDFYLGSEDNSDIVLYENLGVDNPTRIDGYNQVDILLYPNPVTDIITIESSELISSVEVRDLSGNIATVVPVESMKTTFDISSLNSGIYNVIITSNNQSIVKKVVKK